MTPSAAGYRGAHPEDAVRSADVDTMRRLLDSVTEQLVAFLNDFQHWPKLSNPMR
jgi:hypothetical protein